jgi:hypothetical protein
LAAISLVQGATWDSSL